MVWTSSVSSSDSMGEEEYQMAVEVVELDITYHRQARPPCLVLKAARYLRWASTAPVAANDDFIVDINEFCKPDARLSG